MARCNCIYEDVDPPVRCTRDRGSGTYFCPPCTVLACVSVDGEAYGGTAPHEGVAA